MFLTADEKRSVTRNCTRLEARGAGEGWGMGRACGQVFIHEAGESSRIGAQTP
ncbi:hypothetical protein HMPREF0970_00517 [Schaalia odontolytica F0309]|uniref:Uncharacterized protein n=1 Tax=Schaalia odontolytica F0309 TaxID=649742 RepID=D4TX60_9ACTO|nr:hypothetical protein HMPREF0970_00517 [Schaalia odontolytica F0309]